MLSGSRDALRTEFGLYHYVVTDDEGHTKIVKNAVEADDWLVGSGPGDEPPIYIVPPSTYIAGMQTRDFGPRMSSSADVAVETRKFNCRLIGDEENVDSDLHWKTLLLGGTLNNENYKNIFESATFNDHSYDYVRPLNITRAKELARDVDTITSYQNFLHYEIAYNYNYHLPEYENAIKETNNLILPNVYMLQMTANSTDLIKEYPKYIRDFVTLDKYAPTGDGPIPGLKSLFNDASTEEPPPHYKAERDIYSAPGELRYFDQTKRFRDYLGKDYTSASFSAETENIIKQASSTLYYDSDFTGTWFKHVNDEVHRMPMSAYVKFPTEGAFSSTSSLYYSDIIKDNNIQEDLLYFLKNNFGAANENLNFVQETHMLQGGYKNEDDDTVLVYETKLSNDKRASIDFLAALGGIYDSTGFSKESDGIFMGPRSLNTITTENADSRFSFYKRMKTAQAIEDTINKMNNIVTATDGQYDVRRILDTLENNKGPAETIAYRLKKTGGSFLDSDRRLTTIQNMYFMNDNDLRTEGADMIYHDTQIKLNEEYTYTLYAYVVLPGYQYKYDNLRISRQIGVVTVRDTTGSFAPTTADRDICIEFYDPSTDNAASQLLMEETNLLGSEKIIIESDQNLDAFRYAYLIEELTLRDIFPSLDASISYDTFRESTGGLDFESLLADSVGAEPALDNVITALTTLGATGDTQIKQFYADNIPHIYDPSLVHSEGTDADVYSGAFEWHQVTARNKWRDDMTDIGKRIELALYRAWAKKTGTYVYVTSGTEVQVALTEPVNNKFATNAQIKSAYKYLADYNFTIAPSVRIVELPVATKTIRIMDHPPVAPDVTPYQRKDDSQIIGFYVRTESFRVPTDPTNTTTMSSFGIYPTPINNDERTKSQIYKTSNNMIAGEQIAKRSVSRPSMLEVYRIDKKPKSISDFDNNLVFTKDLSIENMQQQKHTSCFYEEKIRTNKKYYYLFRFLNANGDSGYLSPIQVAELINDGGYKYTKFDVIYESELQEEDSRQDSTQFKKLLQITPAIDHLKLNDANVDYSMPAISQKDQLKGMVGNAKDLIWGKTFKFRITSKKTGKKIDLNIKYNLRDT